jgi:hypothetical protein
MSFQWLQMRISEEKDRLQREAKIRACLPKAFEELRVNLLECVGTYNSAFEEPSKLEAEGETMRITLGNDHVDVKTDYALPGFHVEHGQHQLSIIIGLLPGDKLSYRDSEKYLTLEEMTRLILDRTLFPKLLD